MKHRNLWTESCLVLQPGLAGARGLDVASDFDGTLAEIVSHPGRARLSPRARAALGRLARLRGVRVAVLSGRTLADLERRVGLSGVFLAGLAGLETRDTRGRKRTHLGRHRIPGLLVASLRAWCARHPGAWVEDKGPAVAVHYRNLTARRRLAFGAGVRRRIAPHAAAVEVLRGKRVYEVRPGGSPDKAAALARWLAEGRARGRRALFYLGDDVNDQPVFAEVRHRKGFAVAVGGRRAGADYRVASPREVVRLLECLAATWEKRAGRGRPRRSLGSRGAPRAR